TPGSCPAGQQGKGRALPGPGGALRSRFPGAGRKDDLGTRVDRQHVAHRQPRALGDALDFLHHVRSQIPDRLLVAGGGRDGLFPAPARGVREDFRVAGPAEVDALPRLLTVRPATLPGVAADPEPRIGVHDVLPERSRSGSARLPTRTSTTLHARTSPVS